MLSLSWQQFALEEKQKWARLMLTCLCVLGWYPLGIVTASDQNTESSHTEASSSYRYSTKM